MSVIKSFFISFSIYSKIPVPQFAWKEEDMKYTLCFFPWVGALIGLLTWLWAVFCQYFSVGPLCFAMLGTAIPILVSGGFHVDGFLDTMDALHSYQGRERKLEILKDSHIGAFAVIMLALYYLIYIGAYSEIQNTQAMAVLGAGFFLSRTLSGISVVCFQPAKEDGMLYLFADSAQKRIVKISLFGQLVLCIALLLFLSVQAGAFVIAAAGLSFAYYRSRSYREFGGITGDLAGWFVTLCEGAMAVAAAAACIF